MLSMLTRAIEARDPYTRGHSSRVTALAEAVARAPRLERGAHRVAAARRAAARHRQARGLRRGAAARPAALDDDELAQIREHPKIGARLLLRVTDAPRGDSLRALPPRALGRRRLPVRASAGEEIPRRGASAGDRRRVRRDDERPALPRRTVAREALAEVERCAGHAVRPEDRARLPRGLRPSDTAGDVRAAAASTSPASSASGG